MTNLFYGALAYFPIVMVSAGLVLLIVYITMWVMKKNKMFTDCRTDLHLAYNKVKYIISGKKNNDTWTMDITFSDTYDFEKQLWKNAMTSNPAVTVLNNYAAYAQSLKAIVPFKIRVVVKSTFKV